MDEHCSCRVIGPGTYPPGDPDGSKSRAKFEQDGGCGQFAKDKEQKKPQDTGCYVGLDLSLCATGFCLKCGNTITVDTIKTVPKDFTNDLARLIHIRDALMLKIPANVKMICIEDFFVPRSVFQAGSAIKIAMLGTVIRMALYEKGISFFIVAPNSLKKYILGKGVGEKDLIVREVYKKYGLEVKDNDQADAVVLAHIAESVCLARSKATQDGQTKPQKEVVDTLLAAREDRGYNLLGK